MADARQHRFDVVLAEALDRISRDQEHIAGIWKGLSFSGARLVTLSEGEINELHVGLKGTMNVLLLKDLAAKTHRGVQGRVQAGKSGGGLCYGYDVVRSVDQRDEPVRVRGLPHDGAAGADDGSVRWTSSWSATCVDDLPRTDHYDKQRAHTCGAAR